MTAAYEELLHVLDERDINYSTGEDQSIRTTIQGDVATYWTAARVEEDLFQVACFSPLRIPVGSRRDIAEAIVRANYGLRVGKFEMDFDDGEIRFQVSQILDGDAVGPAVIDRMIGTAVNMMDTYLPAFLAVVYANDPPNEAVAWVEAGWPGQPVKSHSSCQVSRAQRALSRWRRGPRARLRNLPFGPSPGGQEMLSTNRRPENTASRHSGVRFMERLANTSCPLLTTRFHEESSVSSFNSPVAMSRLASHGGMASRLCRRSTRLFSVRKRCQASQPSRGSKSSELPPGLPTPRRSRSRLTLVQPEAILVPATGRAQCEGVTNERIRTSRMIAQDNNRTVAQSLTKMLPRVHRHETRWTNMARVLRTALFVDSHLISTVQTADLRDYGKRRFMENGETGLFDRIYSRFNRPNKAVLAFNITRLLAVAAVFAQTVRSFVVRGPSIRQEKT